MEKIDETASKPPLFKPVGENAFLLEFTPNDNVICSEDVQAQVWAAMQWIEPRRTELSIEEAVPGIGNLLLQFKHGLHQFTKTPKWQQGLLTHILDQVSVLKPQDSDPHEIEIPIAYGGQWGPDLDIVANTLGLDTDEVIARHSNALYRVFCLGFQPGFAYLGGLDPALHCPRKQTPAIQIPAGSVAIGGAQTGIYPFASPGGWQIIGRTNCKLFNPLRDHPSLMQAGDRVRFKVVRAL